MGVYSALISNVFDYTVKTRINANRSREVGGRVIEELRCVNIEFPLFVERSNRDNEVFTMQRRALMIKSS